MEIDELRPSSLTLGEHLGIRAGAELQAIIHMLDSPDAGGEAIRALGIPVTYLLAEHDRALAAPGTELAARVGVTPAIVPGTHEALLTHPDDVAKALLQA